MIKGLTSKFASLKLNNSLRWLMLDFGLQAQRQQG